MQLNLESHKCNTSNIDKENKRKTMEDVDRYGATQERTKRNKENQERWNMLKEVALKKMSSGEKLTFEEMKLIFKNNSTPE